jgi:hypothetical protein
MNFRRLALSLGLLAVLASPLASSADQNRFRARLDGYQEVPSAISTPARGFFTARHVARTGMLEYKLTYQDLSADVTQAHIHFGRPAVAGGIMVFLCSNLSSPPRPTPACPLREGTVSGALTAADVLAINSQGIAEGEFDELILALRNGAGYVNVHTTAFPGGEIRGDIR